MLFHCSTNVVMNYTEPESKVREATNDQSWGPHGSLMSEIAQLTYSYEAFGEVMGMLWKRMLHDNRRDWRRVYKVQISDFSLRHTPYGSSIVPRVLVSSTMVTLDAVEDLSPTGADN